MCQLQRKENKEENKTKGKVTEKTLIDFYLYLLYKKLSEAFPFS